MRSSHASVPAYVALAAAIGLNRLARRIAAIGRYPNSDLINAIGRQASRSAKFADLNIDRKDIQ